MILDHFDLDDLAGAPLVEKEQRMEAFLAKWRPAISRQRALLFVDERHARVLVLNASVFPKLSAAA